mmetsp:Transcript_402/g.534  ORF Transcript_402/g.534 Transcript_402/m.534 type:complete len:162 (-) Transcript_402:155-640(-)
MSKEALRAPIVVCKRGLLYNKEHLIKRFLEKNMPREFRHIVKLSRDTCQVQTACLSTEQGSDGANRVLLQCALSKQTLNGILKFFIGFECGCLLSQSSLDMILGSSREAKSRAIAAYEEEKKEEPAASQSDLCPACSQKQGQLVSLNQTSIEQAVFMDSFD